MNRGKSAIDELFALVKEAGAEVTLHGKPVTVKQLKKEAERLLVARVRESWRKAARFERPKHPKRGKAKR